MFPLNTHSSSSPFLMGLLPQNTRFSTPLCKNSHFVGNNLISADAERAGIIPAHLKLDIPTVPNTGLWYIPEDTVTR